MPQQIEFEGTTHEFPDDFSDEDIAQALASDTKTPDPMHALSKASSIGASTGGVSLEGSKGIPGVLSGVMKSIESAGITGGSYLRKIPGVNALDKVMTPFAVDATPRNEDERLGDVIGQIAMMKPGAQPVASTVSKGVALAGKGLEAAGEAKLAQSASKIGALDALIKGHPMQAAGMFFGPRAASLVGRVLQYAPKFPEEAEAATAVTNPGRMLTSGARAAEAGADASFVKGVPAEYAKTELAARPVRGLLTEGRRTINLPAAMEDASFVKSVPAEVAASTKAPVAAAEAKAIIPKQTKADVARITALDKELGSVEAARALRHDPRFAGMSAEERVNAIRSLSSEIPNDLPAKATRAIDIKFDALHPSKRAAYIDSWKTVNPAVYRYLLSK